MKIFIKNGHLIDPTQKIDEICDILIEDGKIKEMQRLKGKGQRAGEQNKASNLKR